MERPSCPEGCFLGQSEASFRVFFVSAERKKLENNDLFVIRKKLQVSQKE